MISKLAGTDIGENKAAPMAAGASSCPIGRTQFPSISGLSFRDLAQIEGRGVRALHPTLV